MSLQTSQQPVKEFRGGTITAAIWRNETTDAERTVVQHSVRVRKTYRDSKTGEWKESDYLFPNELPKLILVAQKAYEFITLRESEDTSDPQEESEEESQ